MVCFLACSSLEVLLSCFPGDGWLYCVSKNEWKPFKHGHTESPRYSSLPAVNHEMLSDGTRHSGFSWTETFVCFCVQVVAHSVLRPRRGGVCVWRVCQQPFGSSESCKVHTRPFTKSLLFFLNFTFFYSPFLQAHSNELLVFNVQPKSLVR